MFFDLLAILLALESHSPWVSVGEWTRRIRSEEKHRSIRIDLGLQYENELQNHQVRWNSTSPNIIRRKWSRWARRKRVPVTFVRPLWNPVSTLEPILVSICQDRHISMRWSRISIEFTRNWMRPFVDEHSRSLWKLNSFERTATLRHERAFLVMYSLARRSVDLIVRLQWYWTDLNLVEMRQRPLLTLGSIVMMIGFHLIFM